MKNSGELFCLERGQIQTTGGYTESPARVDVAERQYVVEHNVTWQEWQGVRFKLKAHSHVCVTEKKVFDAYTESP